MRKIFYAAAVLMACCGCSGQSDDNYEQISDRFVEPFTLSVDKSSIESDGHDAAIFSLKDSYGREMLEDMETMSSINIYEVSTKQRLERLTREFSSIDDGNFTFEATYQGIKSANTVSLKSQNRVKYEVFHKNVAIHKVTSVGCPACPNLSKNLHNIDEETADHIIVMECHGNYGINDPFSLYVGSQDLGTWMLMYFSKASWPTLIYDMNHAEAGVVSTTDLQSNVYKRRVDSPATCGIKINSSSSRNDGDDTYIDVSATVKSSTSGDYDLGFAVICDGLVYRGGYSENDDGIYDDVILSLTSNFASFSLMSIESVAKDKEKTFEMTAKISTEVFKAYKNKLDIVVFAHKRTSDGNSCIDNCATCGFGESLDYRYN